MNKIEYIWFRVTDFWKNWIWPAYNVRHLVYRYDLVRMPQIKAYAYSDIVERMLQANMELVREFVEKEKPEEHVEWYGEFGNTYNGDLFPELKGKYIMDIIKEIYNWWTVGIKQDQKEFEHLLYVCDINFVREKWYKDDDVDLIVDENDMPKSAEELKEADWTILDKYSDGDRNNFLSLSFIDEKMNFVETELERKKQYYLHLCIEVRNYLWT